MTTSQKLWLGFGTLTALLVLVLVFVAIIVRVRSIEGQMGELGDARNLSAVALELEINTLGYPLNVRAYLQTGEPQARQAAVDDAANAARQLKEYARLATTDRQRDMAARFAPLWQEFQKLGQALLDAENRQVKPEDLTKLYVVRNGLEKLLNDEMQVDAMESYNARSNAAQQYGQTIEGFALILVIVGAVVAVVTSGAVGRAVVSGERIIAEQAERLRTTLASIGDGVIATDSEGRITQLNPVAESLTGLTTAEALGQPLDTVFRIKNEETRQTVENPVTKALKEGIIVGPANHTILIARDDTERFIEETASPIRCKDGEILGSVLLFRDISERTRAEAVHRLSEEKFRGLLESAPDAMIITNREGVIVLANAQTGRLFGYGREELLGQRVEMLMPARYRSRHTEHMEGFVASPQTRAMGLGQELLAQRKDGSEFSVEISLSPLETAEGMLVSTAIRDITDRKRADDALRASKQFYQAAFDSLPLHVVVLDVDGVVLAVNGPWLTFAEKNGALPERCGSGTNYLDVCRAAAALGDADAGAVALGVEAVLNGRQTAFSVEYACDSPSEQRWFVMHARRPCEPLKGAIITHWSITDRKHVEEALRESEALHCDNAQRMTLATEATGVGIWEWHLPSNRVRWDATMFSIFGVTPTPDGFVRYETWSSAVLPEDLAEREAAVQDTIRGRGHSRGKFRIRRANNGACRHIEAVETVRTNAQGQVEWVVGTNLDVTARQNAEQALRDIDHRKDEFLATLAHELRNPLASVGNAVQILRIKSPDIPELHWATEIIEGQTQAMVRLIDDLMDISRIKQNRIELKREQIELANIVQGAVETSRPLIEEMGHKLTVTLPPGPVIVDADLTRLVQVFLNLLNNAAKYTERGGRIDLRAELQGSDVVVSVTDTGIGIPADKLPTLFEMFSQVEEALSRSQGGLGIGLCLVKRLVEMHGGSVEAKSGGLGQGSEFVVRLPIVVEQTYPRQVSDDGDQAQPTSDLRILVVDDNRDAAESLAMLLKMMGNNVHTAHDGEEAVTAAREFQPQLVLCDIGLPKLNGYEACRQMKAQAWDKNMILIAVTGWGQANDRRKAREAGFDDHLVKPVDPQALMKLLAKLESVKV